MPSSKSTIKRLKQNITRYKKNKNSRNAMKTAIKNISNSNMEKNKAIRIIAKHASKKNNSSQKCI